MKDSTKGKRVTLSGKSGTYTVIAGDENLIAKSDWYRLYLCFPEGEPSRHMMLKVAASEKDNPMLDREVFVLQQMAECAKNVEQLHSRDFPGAAPLNNHFAFPQVVDSFVSEKQGGRQVAVLSYHYTELLSSWLPILHLRTRDHVRVDPKTSAWILGKLLKVLVFMHDQGFYGFDLSGKNVLIHPDKRYVALFDLSRTELVPDGEEGVPHATRSSEIAHASRTVIESLGGNLSARTIPNHQDLFTEYEDVLWQLADGRFRRTGEAHRKFYEVVRGEWGSSFHPFTTIQL